MLTFANAHKNWTHIEWKGACLVMNQNLIFLVQMTHPRFGALKIIF
jgi:hypothetical protein